jgi:RHS repeat-associated protein
VTSLRRYYRGRNLVAVRDVAAGQNRYYHFDHQGTTQCLTDQTGAVTDRFASDAWGLQVKRTGTSINRHWYVGRLGYHRQADQALEYLRARFRRVNAARFVSADPIGTPWAQARPWGPEPGPNGYSYVLNRPTVLLDPMGLQAQQEDHRYDTCCPADAPGTPTSSPWRRVQVGLYFYYGSNRHPTHPHPPTQDPQADVNAANRIMAQCCICVEWMFSAVFDRARTLKTLGGILRFVGRRDGHLDPELPGVIGLRDNQLAVNGVVHVYFVGGIDTQPPLVGPIRGYSFSSFPLAGARPYPPKYSPALALPNEAQPADLAHELGHVLSLSHFARAGNLMDPRYTGTALDVSQCDAMRKVAALVQPASCPEREMENAS